MALKKLTRQQRLIARMENLEADLQTSTRKADILIVDHKEHMKNVAQAVKAATKKWTPDQQAAIDALTAIDEKCSSLAKPLATLLNLIDPTYQDAMAEVTDTKKADTKKADTITPEFPFSVMALVKLTKPMGSHDYPLNKPILVLHGDHGVIWDAKEKAWAFGNHMPADLDCYKSVTTKELTAAAENFDRLPIVPED